MTHLWSGNLAFGPHLSNSDQIVGYLTDPKRKRSFHKMIEMCTDINADFNQILSMSPSNANGNGNGNEIHPFHSMTARDKYLFVREKYLKPFVISYLRMRYEI